MRNVRVVPRWPNENNILVDGVLFMFKMWYVTD